MSILTWIEDKKRLKVLNAPKHANASTDSSKGLWTRCDKCGVILYIKHLKENQRVCFGCSYHLQMMSQERIENLLDKVPATSFLSPNKSKQVMLACKASNPNKSQICNPYGANKPVSSASGKKKKKSQTDLSEVLRPGPSPKVMGQSSRDSMVSTWRPLDETVSPCNPLKFYDQKAYTDRLQDAQERTGLQDAIQTGTGMIDGIPVALAVMDFSFMGGSMGSVVGEKITRLIEYATQEGLTLLIVSASGGARMQEGVFSLMQMAKISSALQIYQSCARLLYISILTSPTTGGVTASFAMLGDIIFAEPKALIAFAGRRVIEQTLREDLPEDFQTSEYMLHHGLVDLIVPRRFLRQALSESIRLYQNAPFKKRGQIPFGVQNPITFLTEEKIRRQWGGLTKPGQKAFTYKSLPSEYKSSVTKQSFVKQVQSSAYKAELCTSNCKKLCTCKNRANLAKIRKERSEQLFTTNSQGSRGLQDSLLYSPRNFSVKEQESFNGMSYREILTSFEIMLHLFLSGNTKKQNKPLCPKGQLPEGLLSHTRQSLVSGGGALPRGVFARDSLSNCFDLFSAKKVNSFVPSKKPKKTREVRGPFDRLSLFSNKALSRPSLLRSFRSFSESRQTSCCPYKAYKSPPLQIGDLYGAYKAPLCKGFAAKAKTPRQGPLPYKSWGQSPLPLRAKICNPYLQSEALYAVQKTKPFDNSPFGRVSLRGTRFVRAKNEATLFRDIDRANKGNSSFPRNEPYSNALAYALKKQELDSTFRNRSAIGFTRTAFFQERGASFLQDSYQSHNLERLLRKKRNFVTSENGKAEKVWCFSMLCMQLWCQQKAKIDRYTKQSFASTSLRDTFHLLQKSKHNLSSVQIKEGDHTKQSFVRNNICTPSIASNHTGLCKPYGRKVGVQPKNIDRVKSFILPAKVGKSKSREKTSRLKGWEVSKESLPLYEKASKKSGENGALSKENTVFTAQEKDINFLNRAIELAATESVEWRAFYIYQQLSENTGFLEDFLQQDLDFQARAGNVLFYKSICQSRKAIDE